MSGGQWVSSSARIADDAEIGLSTRIHDNVIIESGCRIGDHCVIGHPAEIAEGDEPLFLGKNAHIRSHSILYAGSHIGEDLETGHHVVIREGSKIGKNLRVGNFSDIEGACHIGDFNRFHGYVHVGRGSQIGNFVWIYSLTTLANDPLPPSRFVAPVVIHDGVVICLSCVVMPGAVLGEGAYISASSRIEGAINPGVVVDWRDGKEKIHVTSLFDIKHGVRHPWMNHYKDAYPEEAWPAIDELKNRVNKQKK